MMNTLMIFFALVLFLATLEADVGADTVGFLDSQEPVSASGRHRIFRNDAKPWPDSRTRDVVLPKDDNNKRSVEKERELILSGKASTYQLNRKADVGVKDDKYSTENKGDDQRHRKFTNCTNPWPVTSKDYNKRTTEAGGKERLTVEKERALSLSGRQASTRQLDRMADHVGAKDDKYSTSNNDDRHRLFRNRSNPWPASRPHTVPTKVYSQRKP